jgi:hypothetical protein
MEMEMAETKSLMEWPTNQVHDELALANDEPSLAQRSAEYNNFGFVNEICQEPGGF